MNGLREEPRWVRTEGRPPAPPPPPEEADWWPSYGSALRRGKWLLFLSIVVGGVGGWRLAEWRSPVYEASATLELQFPNESFLNLSDVSPTAASARTTPRGELQTHVRLISSAGLVERTVAELRAAGLGVDAALRQAADTAKARADDDSRVIELRARSSSPALAAAFVNRLAARYIAESAERRRAAADETHGWLAEQSRAFRERLEEAEARLRAYVDEHDLGPLTPEGAAVVDRVRAFERELDAARADAARQKIWADLAANDAAALELLDESGVLRTRRAELTELRRRFAELDALYTPEHHLVKQIAAQIAELERAEADERTRLAARARQSREAAERRAATLAAQHADLLAETAAVQRRGIGYEILLREAAANRALYDTFLARAQQAGVAAAAPAPMLRIVDEAAPPGEPVSPGPPQTAAAGLALGLALAAALAVGRERLDPKFRRPGEVASRLRLAELGSVPDAVRVRKERRATVAAVAMVPARPVEVVAGDPAGEPLMAESFRAVRQAILRGGHGGVYVVTSAVEGDGKTTVAANLALSLAEMDKPVLLIDADLRRPRQHRVFGLLNRRGLGELLQLDRVGDEQIDQALRRVEGARNLALLPAGITLPADIGMLHSARMGRLIEALRMRFGVVVIDTPPVLATTDARSVARWADGVALVVRAGRTAPEDVDEAARLLAADGSPLLGAVLNSWDPRGSRRYDAYLNGRAA